MSFRLWRPDGPYAIYGFVWDRDQPLLSPRVTVGNDIVPGLETTSRQVQRLAGPNQQPVAAVNGDFFTMSGPGQGTTVGLCVRDGELIGMAYGRPAFVVRRDGSLGIESLETTVQLYDAAGKPYDVERVNNTRGAQILAIYTPAWGKSTDTDGEGLEVPLRWVDGPARKLGGNTDAWVEVTAAAEPGKGNRAIPADGLVLSGAGLVTTRLSKLVPGDRLHVVTKTDPPEALTEAIAGSSILCALGDVSYRAGATEPRHPRTAVGYDGKQAVCVVVDGRRPGHSIGMTLPELADFMHGLGCRDALNLDGGGSSTCWVRGRILNLPSDGHERPVANALALVSRSALGQPAKIVFNPPGPLRLAPGAQVAVTATVTDALLNPVPGAKVESLAIAGNSARWSGGKITAGELPGTARLLAKGAGLSAGLEVDVVAGVAKLVAEPTRLDLVTGDERAVTVAGRDAAGAPVVLAPERLRWMLPTAVGTARDGKVLAGPDGGRGVLVVDGYGGRVQIPVAVASPVTVESFDGTAAPVYSGFPETVQGSATRLTEAEPTLGFCRLTWHLGKQPATRAAYVRVEHKLGNVLALRGRVRGDGQSVWLRAALIDGNNERATFTLFQGKLGRDWIPVSCRLPDGLKRPVTWQSVYVVAAEPGAATDGVVDWDALQAVELP